MARPVRRRYELKSQELNASIEALITAAEAVYGDFEESPFTADSPKQIFVCSRA